MLAQLLSAHMPNIPHVIDGLRNVLAGGIGVWVLTEIAKRWNAIPLDPTKKGAIRKTAAALSAAATLLLAAADGKVEPTQLSHILDAALMFVSTWLMAHLAHKTNKGVDALRNAGKE